MTIEKIRSIGSKYLGSTSLEGFKYLCEIAEIILNDSNIYPKYQVTFLYETIAQLNNTSSSKVERSIRYFKNKMLNQNIIDLTFKVYIHDKFY